MLRIKDLHDELKREKDKNIRLTQALEKRYSFGNILGKNNRMQQIFELISDIANTDSTVLIQGESGTGKELIARAIHFGGPAVRMVTHYGITRAHIDAALVAVRHAVRGA